MHASHKHSSRCCPSAVERARRPAVLSYLTHCYPGAGSEAGARTFSRSTHGTGRQLSRALPSSRNTWRTSPELCMHMEPPMAFCICISRLLTQAASWVLRVYCQSQLFSVAFTRGAPRRMLIDTPGRRTWPSSPARFPARLMSTHGKPAARSSVSCWILVQVEGVGIGPYKGLRCSQCLLPELGIT